MVCRPNRISCPLNADLTLRRAETSLCTMFESRIQMRRCDGARFEELAQHSLTDFLLPGYERHLEFRISTVQSQSASAVSTAATSRAPSPARDHIPQELSLVAWRPDIQCRRTPSFPGVLLPAERLWKTHSCSGTSSGHLTVVHGFNCLPKASWVNWHNKPAVPSVCPRSVDIIIEGTSS